MTASTNGWTESDSKLYQDIAAVAVPARAEQMAALLTLLPFGQDAAFRAVEVGCGEGILSAALLDCFPQAHMVALDGSAEMRDQASRRLDVFGPRAAVEPFDLFARDWYEHLQDADCVVSSLCLHHLDGSEKQDLFAVMFEQLSAQGVFLMADLVKPQRPEAQALFAATWDRLTETQSIAETGSTELYQKFQEIEWNLYRFADPIDNPSSLFEQLIWLKTAGFEVVDCFWLQAGHAIYGGYKTTGSNTYPGVSFAAALRSVKTVLAKSG